MEGKHSSICKASSKLCSQLLPQDLARWGLGNGFNEKYSIYSFVEYNLQKHSEWQFRFNLNSNAYCKDSKHFETPPKLDP